MINAWDVVLILLIATAISCAGILWIEDGAWPSWLSVFE